MMSIHITKDGWEFIDSVVVNLCNRYGVPYSSFDDTLQDVRLELLGSNYLSRYDSSKGNWGTYAYPRILGAFKSSVRSSKNGGVRNKDAKGRRKIVPSDVLDLENIDEDINYALAVDERTQNKIEAKDLLNKVLPKLPQLYRNVLKLHYMYGMPMVEMGQLRNVSTSRISQICREAVAEARGECERIS